MKGRRRMSDLEKDDYTTRDEYGANAAVVYAKHFIGIQYRFGDDEFHGDDPIYGFDCSGLISEVLRRHGTIPYNGRLSAQGFYDYFIRGLGRECTYQRPGVLVFYGKSKDKITHIAMMVGSNHVIMAGGGARTTKDSDEAARRNAFVMERPCEYRSDIVAYADPFNEGPDSDIL